MNYPRPNFILVIVDDLWWADFPQFGTPITWKVNGMEDLTLRADEQRIQRPDLNRLAARIFADPMTGTVGTFTPAGGSAFTVKPITPLTNNKFTPGYCSSLAGCSDSEDTKIHEDVLGGFGGLNRIAGNGAVFSRYSAPTTYCGPARATIFSGRHTKRHGVGSNGGAELVNQEVTIPEWLRQFCLPITERPPRAPYLTNPPLSAQTPNNCYNTMLIGKWHGGHSSGQTVTDGSAPWRQGFKYFAGHLGSAVRGYFNNQPLTCFPTGDPGLPGCNGIAGVDGLLDVYGDRDRFATLRCNIDSEAHTNEGLCTCSGAADCGSGGVCSNGICSAGGSSVCREDDECASQYCVACNYSTRVYAKLATEFIGRNVNSPFFLVVSFNAVHVPHAAPERTTKHYQQEYPPRGRERGKRYWPALEEIDAAVGKIIDKLDSTSLRSKTIVMVTGDHGAPHRDYGLPILSGGKGNITEGGTRVGLLASACNQNLSGRNLSKHVANHADLFATVAEAAGMPFPSPSSPVQHSSYIIDGQSFYSLLLTSGSDAFVRHFTFGRYYRATIASREGRYVDEDAATLPTPGPELDPMNEGSTFNDASDGVCGVSVQNTNDVTIRGGSCQVCDADASPDPMDCTEELCPVVGKVCVSKPVTGPIGRCYNENGTLQTYVDDPDPRPCTRNSEYDCTLCNHEWQNSVDPTTLHRCASDADCVDPMGQSMCAGNDPCICADITIKCEQCMRPAWKLYKNEAHGSPAKALFDLTTNPEEDKNINCINHAAFAAEQLDLKCRLEGWQLCTAEDTNAMVTTDAVNDTPCDTCYEESSNPCRLTSPYTTPSSPPSVPLTGRTCP